MRRTVLAVGLLGAALAVEIDKAGAAGIYEDASAVPAFFFAPQQIAVDAVAVSSAGGAAEASLYQLRGMFPVRGRFLVALQQGFIAVSAPTGIDAGIGDFTIRVRGLLFGGARRSFFLAAGFNPGSNNPQFFPYSTETREASAAAGYVDTLGVARAWASGSYAWVSHVPDDSLRASQNDYARLGAGAAISISPRLSAGAGVVLLRYAHGAHRDLVFAGAALEWSKLLALIVQAQAEVGPERDRTEDWSAGLGVRVRF